MAINERQFGWDSPAGGALTVGGVNIKPIFNSITLRIEADTMEARAANDTVATTGGISNGEILGWRFPRIRSRSWTLDCEGVVDGVDGADLMGLAISEEGNLAVVIETANIVFSGNAVVTGGGLDLPGEAASQSLSLLGTGSPSVELQDA